MFESLALQVQSVRARGVNLPSPDGQLIASWSGASLEGEGQCGHPHALLLQEEGH